jgi:hypothetical protein
MNKSLPRTKGMACFLKTNLHIWTEKKIHIQRGKKEGRLIEFSLRDCVMGHRPHDENNFIFFIFILFD